MALSGASKCKSRIDKIAKVLPGTMQRPGGEKSLHCAYMVGAKTFAYFTDDHHGNGRLALWCRAPEGDQAALISADPGRFFVPPYLGHRGWVGLWLDLPNVDWGQVEELMGDAYLLVVPERTRRLRPPLRRVPAPGHSN